MADGMAHTLGGEEIQGLAWSILGMGVAFTILFFVPTTHIADMSVPAVIAGFIVSLVLVALSYIPHEMTHRLTARSVDAYAEYRMWKPGIVLAVLTSFLGGVFAATGGTRMYTRTGERYGLSLPDLTIQNIGFVSVVGPLLNIGIAFFFVFLAASVTGVTLYGISILVMAAKINIYIALANMVPFYPMDGYKVLRWSTLMWVLPIILAGVAWLLL